MEKNKWNSTDKLLDAFSHVVPPSGCRVPPSSPMYSVTRVRVVMVLLSVMYLAAVMPNATLLSQYVVHRLAMERGLVANISNTGFSHCGSNKTDPLVKQFNDIQAEASTLLLYFKYSQSLPAAVVCILLGGYTDVLGRRPLLLITLITGFLRTFSYSVIIRFELPLELFYAAHLVDSCSGTYLIFFTCVYCIIADLSPAQSDRALWIAIVGCFYSIGISGMTAVDGYIINYLNYFAASLIPTCTMTTALFSAFFFLPETLEAPHQKKTSVLDNVRRIVNFFLYTGSLRRRLSLVLCLFMFMFSVVNTLTLTTMDALYQMQMPFCWSPRLIGMYCGLRVGVQYVAGLPLLRLLQRCLQDEWIAALGMLFQTASYVFEAFVTESWQFILVPLIGILGVTSVPVIRAMISSFAEPSDQGTVLSSISTVEAMCSAFSNTVVLQLYAQTLATMPGAVFLLLASFSFVTVLLLMVSMCVVEKSEYEALLGVDSPTTGGPKCLHPAVDFTADGAK